MIYAEKRAPRIMQNLKGPSMHFLARVKKVRMGEVRIKKGIRKILLYGHMDLKNGPYRKEPFFEHLTRNW
jgi:hypothetical protein